MADYQNYLESNQDRFLEELFELSAYSQHFGAARTRRGRRACRPLGRQAIDCCRRGECRGVANGRPPCGLR